MGPKQRNRILLIAALISEAALGVTFQKQAPELRSSRARIVSSRIGSGPLRTSDCRLFLKGRPFNGIGVNMVDLLPNVYPGSEAGVGTSALRMLAAHHIPFVRFPVLPFRPVEMRRVIADPGSVLRSMDPIVEEAEASGIGLIPSVFFAFRTLPKAFDEPVSAWGDAGSRTSQFASMFSRKLAERYAHSSSIWMWEFANEANDWADLVGAHQYFTYHFDPSVKFDQHDEYSSKILNDAFFRFREAINFGDPGRLVTTGHNSPTPNAWQRLHGGSGKDTVADFDEIVAFHASDADVVSMHLYPQTVEEKWSARFPDHPVSTVEAFVPIAADAARSICKPLFLGEFGPLPLQAGASEDIQLPRFVSMLNAILAAKVPLSAMWVYDFKPGSNFSATFDNPLAGRMRAIETANSRLQDRTVE